MRFGIWGNLKESQDPLKAGQALPVYHQWGQWPHKGRSMHFQVNPQKTLTKHTYKNAHSFLLTIVETKFDLNCHQSEMPFPSCVCLFWRALMRPLGKSVAAGPVFVPQINNFISSGLPCLYCSRMCHYCKKYSAFFKRIKMSRVDIAHFFPFKNT